MGFNPNPNAEGKANAIFYTEITNPEEKLYFVPSWFTNLVGKDRFSASTANTPFVTDRNPNYKGKFPALFASGRVALMDQDPVRHQGISINAAHNRWIYPKR
jgi:hypothetical protein